MCCRQLPFKRLQNLHVSAELHMEKEKAAKNSKDTDENKEKHTKEDIVSRGDHLKPW